MTDEGDGPSGLPDFGRLLEQAQSMQAQLMQARAEAADQEVVGQSGGGMVKVTLTGGMDARGVTIDPSVVDPADVGMLEDLVLAAVRDALARAAEVSDKALEGVDLGKLGSGLLG